MYCKLVRWETNTTCSINTFGETFGRHSVHRRKITPYPKQWERDKKEGQRGNNQNQISRFPSNNDKNTFWTYNQAIKKPGLCIKLCSPLKDCDLKDCDLIGLLTENTKTFWSWFLKTYVFMFICWFSVRNLLTSSNIKWKHERHKNIWRQNWRWAKDAKVHNGSYNKNPRS